MDCIPAGMELFPAADEEQFDFIKSIVNDCDYYVLIIGGRYGSLSPEGVSYTEKEYDYARELGLQVLAFVHEAPGKIAFEKSEVDPALREKLDAFRDKVKTGRLVRMWDDAKQLPGLVALSLAKTIKTHPAVGWVRADKIANSELLSDLNSLRKRNEELESTIQGLTPTFDGIAGLDEELDLSGLERPHISYPLQSWSFTSTWAEVFVTLAPHALAEPNDALMQTYFQTVIAGLVEAGGHERGPGWLVSDKDYQKVKVQFSALNLIELHMATTVKGGRALFWALTPLGQATLLALGTTKTLKSS